MAKTDWFGECPYVTSQQLLSGKWAVPVLHQLCGGTLRFGELKRQLPPALTQATLTKQLRDLEAAGLLRRKVYAEVPPRVEYSLTPIGREFEKVLDSLGIWGQSYIEYLRARDGANVKSAASR